MESQLKNQTITVIEDDEDFDPIPSFETAAEERKRRIAELHEGNGADRRLAALLKKCRKGSRCDLVKCAVCERRKLIALRGVPSSAIKSVGWLDRITTIYLRAITVIGDRRPLNQQKVIALAASMNEIGLQTPITVYDRKKDVVLIAGRHRLAAAARLAWDAIPCVVVPADKTKNRIWQLAENYYRAELTVLDRSETTEELRTLIHQKRELEEGQVARPGGHQPNDAGIKKTADALGITREEVRRARTIAGISPKAKARVREIGLDDNQQALLEIARQVTPEGQLRTIEVIVERKRAESSRRASEPTENPQAMEKAEALDAEIRQQATDLAAKRKRLRLMEDKLAVQGEAAVTNQHDATVLSPLAPDDEPKVQALLKTLAKFPKLKTELAKASPVILDRVIAIIRSQQVVNERQT